MSRLDYSNGLFNRLPKCTVSGLQAGSKPYVPHRVLRSAEVNLLTVPPGNPGKYGSRSLARASANLWNSLRGEKAAWLNNSPTLESFKRNLKTFFLLGTVLELS